MSEIQKLQAQIDELKAKGLYSLAALFEIKLMGMIS
jgi:hypothetical protein